MTLSFDGGGRAMAPFLGLVALVTTLSVVSSAAVAPTHAALQLGADNFTTLLAEQPDTRYAMIEFYASWCPACQHFAPTYEKLATFLKEKALGEHTLLIGRVDCAAEPGLCGEFDLKSYPSIYLGRVGLFAAKKHKELTHFSGPRELPNLVGWVGSAFNTTLTYVEATGDSSEGAQKEQQQGVTHKGQGLEGQGQEGQGQEGQGEAAKRTQAERRPVPKGPVWSLEDVEGATLTLWKIVGSTPALHRGTEKRAALRDVLAALAAGHPSGSCKAGAAHLLSRYHQLWPPTEEEAPKELLQAHPCGNSPIFQMPDGWVTCRGSKPESRGFSCGLWQLLHTMAARLPDVSAASTMMGFLLQFNKHLFMCEPCQKHFGKMLTAPEAAAVKDKRSLVLWLWRVHNEVNDRLRFIEHKYGHSTTGDPEWPKEQWPPVEVCPTCRESSSPTGPEAKFGDVKWDEQQVYDYLTKAYGPGSVLGADVAVKVVNTAGALRVRRERRAQPGARSSMSMSWWSLALPVGVVALLLLAYRRMASSSPHGQHGRKSLSPFGAMGFGMSTK